MGHCDAQGQGTAGGCGSDWGPCWLGLGSELKLMTQARLCLLSATTTLPSLTHSNEAFSPRQG